MARIATGDYDCVIVGHTQFQRIPISEERQKEMIEDQIGKLITAIDMAKTGGREQVVGQTDGGKETAAGKQDQRTEQ